MSDSAPSVPDWLTALAARARTVDGAPPFSDGALVEYRSGARSLVAIDESAAALATPTEAEFVVDPDARGRGLGTRLLETLLGSAAKPMLFWAHGDHPAARALAASHGLTPVRTLLHLTSSVGRVASASEQDSVGRVASASERIETGSTHDPAPITAFQVGHDEAEWVALNHRIFEHHAEQGSVTVVDLEQLEREPWFDADDFLLLRNATGAMIGYCWVKIEANVPGNDLGEIYVVGVAPEHQGEKLGGRLFEAGLSRMRERGIHRAHLYVEGDNEKALKLYLSRGFEQLAIDIQYASAG
jgi:mycothiol synthase